MKKTVVFNVVGLTTQLIGEHTPFLERWQQRGKTTSINPVLPAVTCTAQATYYTGVNPDQHGIVANGWYFREECEVKLWRQSNHLIQAPKIWDKARSLDPEFTCANLFGWYNMYSTVDYAVTPRPLYLADGRKIPDIYTEPMELRDWLNSELGEFPLFNFWGPNTSVKSSQWIADAAKQVELKYSPTLTLVYLPHLDYCLQKIGTKPQAIAKDLREIDRICQELIEFYEAKGAKVIVLSEYGITEVSTPIHLNRLFRQQGLITVREELGGEILIPGASKAFAVADHQIAHVYINDPSCLSQVRNILEHTSGIDLILDETGKQKYHLNHSRSGELVAIARPDAWFTYYYWLDDHRAPDFARTVDIHRKPGYDPVELFVNPQLKLPKAKVALSLLKKKLGFRYLIDVIPLDANLVKGSHGHLTASVEQSPLFITQQQNLLTKETIEAQQVFQLILNHLLES
ncbi:MAG: alkaline phosphatase family protein [Pleurocapsa minor HA4230-MV1]|jgi:predicted AlkP superfamily pyrophosphatase or phosphodiesterase|nr:alkaline phosphatase family protein [Pleurocapsa minor HA4230-MV1]